MNNQSNVLLLATDPEKRNLEYIQETINNSLNEDGFSIALLASTNTAEVKTLIEENNIHLLIVGAKTNKALESLVRHARKTRPATPIIAFVNYDEIFDPNNIDEIEKRCRLFKNLQEMGVDAFYQKNLNACDCCYEPLDEVIKNILQKAA